MNVAVPRDQHSDKFGQLADEHTVCSFSSRTIRCTRSSSGEVRTRIFSQGGFAPRSVGTTRLSGGRATR